MTSKQHPGPLSGIRVLEFAGLGPAPFCGMLLADMGADVVRIDRIERTDYKPEDVEARGRESIMLDLKSDAGIALAKALAARADILIEGFRPGVMERLGLGPDDLIADNPALVYGRITGWGREGPLAKQAGHDINYLGLTGALHAMGTKEKPAIPLNLIADFGGGALYLAMGILAALHHARATGNGQVVDTAMIDGVISMMNMIYGDFHAESWIDSRESNVIDGAAPFYNVYRCSDEKWISVASIEPAFYHAFIEAAGVDASNFADQWDRSAWPTRISTLQTLFAQQPRDAWLSRFDCIDACVAPVLSLEEARTHPHNVARQSFQAIDGIIQAGAFPHFSRTPAVTPSGVNRKDSNRDAILHRWELKKS